MLAGDGNLYGTTLSGGASGFAGTVFRISKAGTFTTLHSFNETDGATPNGSLVQGTDGNFYGTTMNGGNASGTAFKMSATGAITTLVNFSPETTNSSFPNPVIQATDGKLYGTTEVGGTDGVGTVFSVGVGLGPFVKTLPPAGKIGTEIGIFGVNLDSATSVTFNGTPAQFTVRLQSLILTHVPIGATNGKIKVTLPTGTLNSNVAFYVLK